MLPELHGPGRVPRDVRAVHGNCGGGDPPSQGGHRKHDEEETKWQRDRKDARH
nr:MAG TPA: hypothetical protein [Caudoviricetes sp.]